MTRAALSLALALLAGCPPPSPRAQEPERLAGRVAVVGSAPMNVRLSLRTPDGRGVFLEGPAAAELRELAGVEVEVEGRMTEGGVFQARGYRIVSVDGRPALVGMVEAAPGGGLQLRLPEGGAVRLEGGADRLRPGQKVWVQGPEQARGSVRQVQVQTFGVIVP
ncbi:MAG TPA: hypothetical protein VFR37_01970 [Longimicrobium sp.]|nr:hypothetical protein [Longimicrobium sp.]